jgi:hypothetical protein
MNNHKPIPVVLRHNTLKVFKKLTSFFLKNGLALKQIGVLLSAIAKTYTHFFYRNEIFLVNPQPYLNTQEFLFILRNTKAFKNLTCILNWVVGINSSQFDLNVQQVSKKYKKKLKKKYLYKVQYLNKKKQLSRVLK